MNVRYSIESNYKGKSPTFPEPLHVGQLNVPAWEEVEEAFRGIFKRRYFANHGPLVREFEERIADYLGVKHAICMTNATIALMVTARSLNLTGEVLTTAFTFPATVQALTWAGVTPVFCDVERETHTISARTAESVITERTSGILGVHVWGRPCDPDGLQELARKRGLSLYYDSAHAFGAGFGGRLIGGLGRAEVFSFHATKVLNCTEGGCVTTNDDDLAASIRTNRNFHESETFIVSNYRINGKMSEAQAAMGLLGLKDLEKNIAANKQRYLAYKDLLNEIPGFEFVDHAGNEKSNYQYVVVEVDEAAAGLSRDEVVTLLKKENVLARRYFYPGVHQADPYRDHFNRNSIPLPETERLVQRVMQLPSGSLITNEHIETICFLLKTFVDNPWYCKRYLSERESARLHLWS